MKTKLWSVFCKYWKRKDWKVERFKGERKSLDTYYLLPDTTLNSHFKFLTSDICFYLFVVKSFIDNLFPFPLLFAKLFHLYTMTAFESELHPVFVHNNCFAFIWCDVIYASSMYSFDTVKKTNFECSVYFFAFSGSLAHLLHYNVFSIELFESFQ